jgi:hypothetical protein
VTLLAQRRLRCVGWVVWVAITVVVGPPLVLVAALCGLTSDGLVLWKAGDANQRTMPQRYRRASDALLVLALGFWLVGVLAGCGDEYEQGAGVFTTTTRTVPTAPAVPVVPVAPRAQARPPEGPETGRLSKRQKGIVRAAKRDARGFLDGYLRYDYGERVKVRNVFPGVLPKEPPRLVPGVGLGERPRLKRGGLQFVGTDHGRVILTARLTNGHVRFLTMRRRGKRRWAVSEVR